MQQISAHWRDMLKGFDGTARGLRGVAHLRGPAFTPLHLWFQRPYHKAGWSLPSLGPFTKAGRTVAWRQRRAFDLNMLRQSLTLAFCDSYGVLKPGSRYVIIGDGYAALGSVIAELDETAEIFFINIPPVLDMDKQFFAMAHPGRLAHFIPAEEQDKFPECRASFDIACMGEINPDVRDSYCQLRAQRSTFIYSCNRESKTFSDGTTTRFSDYDWHDAKLIVDDSCPWHQSFYAFRPPFRRLYEGPFRHKLLRTTLS